MQHMANHRSRVFRCSLFYASIFVVFGLTGPRALLGQPATYHFHLEASTTSGLDQLKTQGPDAAVTTLQSAQLRNVSPGNYVVKEFDTQAGVPGMSGAILSGSAVTFSLWMRKTADFGTMYPRAELRLNNAGGPLLCTALGSGILTTVLARYTLSCTTSATVAVATSDRFYLWAGVSVTTGPGNKAVNAELGIEGTLNGNYDSQVVAPLPGTVPQITSLTPNSGEIGASVIIAGLSFGATQGSSTVMFNGTPATPTGWSETSITAPVPVGATTGPVVVTVNGIASNGVTFTANVGTVSGTVSRASDGTAFSGALVEVLQSGAVKLSATSGAGGAYSITGLATGTYDIRASLPHYATAFKVAASVTAGSTTTANFSLTASAPVNYIYDELGRLTAVIDPASDSAKYTYDAVGNLLSIGRQSASQVVILEFNPGTGFPGTSVKIYGTGFSSNPAENAVQFGGIPAIVTSASATEILTSVPSGAATGPITVTTPLGSATSPAFTVPSDITASIVPGGPPVTVTIPTPGQNARVTFTGRNGQRVSLSIGSATIKESDVSIRDPLGATIAGPVLATIRTNGFIDAVALAADGSYTIVVDPRSTYTGSVNLTLYDVIDVSGAITAGGPSVSVATTIPGQNAKVTFSGTAGQKVSLSVSGVTIPQSDVSIQKPDGTDLVPPTAMDIAGQFLDTKTLPVSGAYTIFVNPRNTYAGSVTLTLYEVVDITASVTPGGPDSVVTMTTPGQNATWTFTGTAGQRVSQYWAIRVFGDHVGGGAYLWLYKPDGSILTAGWLEVEVLDFFSSPGDSFIDTMTLPTNGTYTILADPIAEVTPELTLSLYNVPPDVSGSLTVNGTAVNVSIPVRGQNGALTFNGTVGQQVTVHVTNNNICVGQRVSWGIQNYGVTVSLRRPDGSTLAFAEGCSQTQFDLPTQTLAVDGQYTIFVDPQNYATGSLDVRISNP